MEEKDKIGVYSISLPSGKMYVGMTCNSFKSRWLGHLKKLRLNKHSCRGLQRAFIKYGEESLIFSILISFDVPEDFTKMKLIKNEILKHEVFEWIRLKSEGVIIYNGKPSGNGSVFHTEETRKAIANGMKKHLTEKVCLACLNHFNTNGNFELCRVCRGRVDPFNLQPNNIQRKDSSKICPNCETNFSGNNKYCSKECRIESHKRNLPIKICFNCGKNFSSNNLRFCSKECCSKIHSVINISKEELCELYLNQKLSTTEIAKIKETSHTTIRTRLLELDIPMRKRNEAYSSFRIKENERINKKKELNPKFCLICEKPIKSEYDSMRKTCSKECSKNLKKQTEENNKNRSED